MQRVINFFRKLGAKSLKAKYISVLHSKNPGETVRLARELIDEISNLDAWPSGFPPERVILSDLYFELGSAYIELVPQDASQFGEKAISAFEKCIGFLKPDDGYRLPKSYIHAAISYADREEGNFADNTEVAIRYAKKSLEFLDESEDAELIASTKSILADLIAKRDVGNIKENINAAIALQLESNEALSSHDDPEAWVMGVSKLADLLLKSEDGAKRNNVDRATYLLNDALSRVEMKLSNRSKAEALRVLFNCYVENKFHNPEQNFSHALELSERVIEYYKSANNIESLSSFYMDLGIAWANRKSINRVIEINEAEKYFLAAIEYFSSDRFPEQNKRLESLINLLRSEPEYTSPTFSLSEAIARQKEHLASLDPKTNHVAWIDRSLDLALLLRRDESSGKDRSIAEAISIYERLLTKLTPVDHVEQWIKCTRQMANTLMTRHGPTVFEDKQRARSLLQDLVELADPRTEPRLWVTSNLELAEFIRSDFTESDQDNVEKALAILEITKLVADRDNFPGLYAAVCHSMAQAFKSRKRGNPEDNIYDAAINLMSIKTVELSSIGDAEKTALDIEIQELLHKLSIIKHGDTASDNESSTSPESPASDVHRSNTVAELLEVAENADPDNDFQHWYDAKINAARAQQVTLPSENDSDIADFMDSRATNHEASIKTLYGIRERLEKYKHLQKWAEVHWLISGSNRMAQVWSDFRRTALREAPHDPVAIEQGAKRANIFLIAAADSLEEAISVTPLEYRPGPHLKYAVRLGRLRFEQRNYQKAHHYFSSASKAANMVLPYADSSYGEFEDLLDNLSDLASLAPIAAIELGQHESAIEIAETARSRILSRKLSTGLDLFDNYKRKRVLDLKDRISVSETKLASPNLIDRKSCIDTVIDNKKSLRDLFAKEKLSEFFSMENFEEILLNKNHENTCFILPLLCEFGGFVLIIFCDRGEIKKDVERADENGALRKLFSEGIPGQTDKWQSRYLEFQQTGFRDNEDEWNEILEETASLISLSITRPLDILIQRNSLALKNKNKFVFVPNGPIGYLPIGLSKFGQQLSERLTDSHTVCVIPSLNLVNLSTHNENKISFNDRIGIFYSEVKEADEDPLLLSSLEALTVAKTFEGLNQEVLKTDLKSKDDVFDLLKRTNIWHFISHGTLNSDSSDGMGLTLGNNWKFTARDILELTDELAPKLVVLSACNTGHYDLDHLPNEFLGLPAAFLTAGANSVVASLWPTEDVSSILTFNKFYELLLKAEQEPALALNQSQKWLRELTMPQVFSELNEWLKIPKLSVEIHTQLNELIESNREFANEDTLKPFAAPAYWGGFMHVGI